LAGIYRPKSRIPLNLWQAAPNTTNGNEQAHRHINRRGIKQSLFAGVMHGQDHDWAAIVGIVVNITQNIETRDQIQSHFRRANRALVKSGMQYEYYL